MVRAFGLGLAYIANPSQANPSQTNPSLTLTLVYIHGSAFPKLYILNRISHLLAVPVQATTVV